MLQSQTKDGLYTKVLLASLTVISLLSSGWAMCATMGVRDCARIEKNGTMLSQNVDKRVVVLEAALPYINKQLQDINAKLDERISRQLQDINAKLDEHMRPKP